MRLIIFLFLVTTNLPIFSQVIIKDSSLPLLVENETLIVKTPVWIQSEKSEILQRSVEIKLREKLFDISLILDKKLLLEKSLDSLTVVIEELQDSTKILNKSLEESNYKCLKECDEIVGNTVNKLDAVSEELDKTKNNYKLLKKGTYVLGTIILIETFILLLL